MRQSNWHRRQTSFGVTIVLALVGGCISPPKPAFVPGPETPGLRQRFSGHVIAEAANDPNQIISLSLPDLTRSVIFRKLAAPDDTSYIFATTGPDDEGHVAFIEGNLALRRHRLKVVNLDGSGERVVFDRSGDAMWDHIIGKHPAIAPTGGRIAFVSQLHGVQMPGALLQQGPLDLCDLKDGSLRTVAPAALDFTVTWFPDGQRIAYVALVPTDDQPASKEAGDGFIAAMPGWDRQPAVYVLDLRTRKSLFVHAGWDAVVADDGRSLFITDGPQHETHGRRVWLETGAVDPVTGPSMRIVALKADGTALFVAPPTAGSVPGYTKYYSPLAGPRQLAALKVGILNTARFKTVMQEFDFRDTVSFGKVGWP